MKTICCEHKNDKATRASYKEKREAWGRYADNVNRRAWGLMNPGIFQYSVARFLAAKRAILAEDRAAGRQGGNYADGIM